MTRTFIYFKIFDKNWLEMGLTDDDLVKLEKSIMANPNVGDIIRGTGGVRKMRFALPFRGKGKSGGARVLYVDYFNHKKTVLLNVYSKDEKDDITENEKKQLKQIMDGLSKEWEK